MIEDEPQRRECRRLDIRLTRRARARYRGRHDDQRRAASIYLGCRHGGCSLGSGRGYVGLKASLTCAGGGLPLVLARFCEGGRRTFGDWGKRDAIRMARHRTRRARAWDGCSCGSGSWRRGALVAGHGEGRARLRPIARAGGDMRGERARPEFRLEDAKAGVKGRRVRVRGANSL